MHRNHRSWLPLAAAALSVLVLLPGSAQTTAAATSKWTAKCDSNVRTAPRLSASVKKVIDTGAVVTVSATVTGGAWTASCPNTVKSSKWLKIVAINGKSTTSLFGRSAVYAATALFKVGPTATPPPPKPAVAASYLSNCSVRLRTSASTGAKTKAIIDANVVISAATKVSGGSWSADCKTHVAGSSWYRITAVSGKSVSSLYGVSAVYAATGLFRTQTTSGFREGIDVSHWQGTIDWARVRAAGKTFAIAKASEGVGFADDRYQRNKADAMAQGIKFGAYHFARPGSNSPAAEADWFVNTADIEHGMLIPTLDLERTGGLGTSALISWVKQFVQRVDQRLGVKPMIYVSPAFWRSNMGNTTWFADNGYSVLWVANWGVTSPSVPGDNWGGRSWTFWQYTSSGSVPGISGRVDLNRYRFSSFDAVTY